MKIPLVLLLAAVLAPAQARVIMLGSGNPNPDPDRSGPAVAVVVGDQVYLVDAGPGIVRRASAAKLPMAGLDRVFITHLHSDHTLGLPDLILSPWVLGRTAPLAAYGPVGLAAMTRSIEQAWTQDIAVRRQGLEHANSTGYEVNVHEIQPGPIYHDANLSISAFLVHHGSFSDPPNQSFGYRFQIGTHVVVFSGDTSPVPAIAAACHGCDLLFHEAYNPKGVFPPAWRAYLAAFHTSAPELAKIAVAAHPRTLVLYHQMFEHRPESELLAEVRQGYGGQVISSRDLEVFRLDPNP